MTAISNIFFQNASKKRKSIFMRLVENNDKKGKLIHHDVIPTHDSHGRKIRPRSIRTPKHIKNIEEEPDTSASNAHLPARPSKHRQKTSKHSSLDTAEQTKDETSKSQKLDETPNSGEQFLNKIYKFSTRFIG
jgi:hypothetical protein